MVVLVPGFVLVLPLVVELALMLVWALMLDMGWSSCIAEVNCAVEDGHYNTYDQNVVEVVGWGLLRQ